MAVTEIGPGASDQQYGYIRCVLFCDRNPGPFLRPQAGLFPWSCLGFWFGSSISRCSWRLHLGFGLFLMFFGWCIALLRVVVQRMCLHICCGLIRVQHVLLLLAIIVANSQCQLISVGAGPDLLVKYLTQLITARWRSMLVYCVLLEIQSAHFQLLR